MSPKWPLVALGDVVELLSGFAFKSALFTDNREDAHLVKGENVSQGKILWDISKRWPTALDPKLEKYRLRTNDVVVAMDRPWVPAGLKWAYIREGDPPALLVQRCCRLRTRTKGLAQEYLRYVIGGPDFEAYIKPITTGVNVPHVSGGQILAFKFHLPPVLIQQRTVTVMSAYDDLIVNCQRRVETLQQIAHALYREWLIDFRFPGHDQRPMIASRIGPIPAGWTVRRLGDLMTVDKGVSYNGAGLTSEGNPLVNLKNILPGGCFRRDATKPYSGDFKPRHTVRPGDIVVANTDLTQAGNVVATPVIIPRIGHGQPILISHHLYAVRPLDAHPIFLYQLMLQSEFRGFAKGYASGTTVLGMPKEGLLDFVFPCPPHGLIERLLVHLRAFHGLIENLHERIDLLRSTRDLILPRLLSGRLDLSSLPETAE